MEHYHCESCNIVHGNLECPLCVANMKIKKLRVVVKAAPIMLDALKNIADSEFFSENSFYRIRDIAQAAIDAAEGKNND